MSSTYDNKRYLVDEEDYCIDETKFSRLSLRHESELYNEEDNVPHDLIGVRWVNLPKGEDWEVTKNKKTVLILKGVRFTTREKDFLRTSAGMSFIVDGYKRGWKSVSEFKRQVKKCLPK